MAVNGVLATALPELDRLLGGGFPLGTMVALEGNAGCWSIAARIVARVTDRALAAIIDDGGLYPPALAQAGARLERVLVVPARSPLGIARAADILVRSRACRVVVMTAPDLRAPVWARLATLAARTGILLVVIAGGMAVPVLAAAAGVRLLCTRERLILSGPSNSVWSTVTGYVVRAELRKSKAPSSLDKLGMTSTGGARLADLRVVTNVCSGSLRERIITQRSRASRAALR